MPQIVVKALDPLFDHPLHSVEEVHIRKLLHLIHVDGFDNLLVIVQNPRLGSLVRNRPAYESNIMPRTSLASPFLLKQHVCDRKQEVNIPGMNRSSFVADNASQAELGGELSAASQSACDFDVVLSFVFKITLIIGVAEYPVNGAVDISASLFERLAGLRSADTHCTHHLNALRVDATRCTARSRASQIDRSVDIRILHVTE